MSNAATRTPCVEGARCFGTQILYGFVFAGSTTTLAFRLLTCPF
jgi:hypothetical protein